jgi:hypothetical protein
MFLHRYLIILGLSLFIAFASNAQAPANDNPCSAVSLTVGASCVNTASTNANATATAGVPAPGCASYSGGDVWFTAVVPLSGNVNLESTAGVITDGGMAVYTATSCAGPFTLVECDDDDGTGLMPQLNLTGLAPGSTIYIRFWEFGNNGNGTFSLCVYDATPPPPPASNVCLSPLPDDCSTACNLGVLPAPPNCTGTQSISNGGYLSFNMSNVAATASNPYSTVAGCAIPASDVWFRFQATGTQLSLFLNSDPADSLVTPNVSLYQGNACNALLPLACFTGSNGSLPSTVFAPLSPGGFYYIQISGNSVADVGNFTLFIRNNLLCNPCLLGSTFTATPPPTNGSYNAGQTVTFCYTVNNYSTTAANWLSGIDLDFGPGWNLASLTPTTIPTSCATTAGAAWGFYNSVTGTNSGATYGPGFFYETSAGGPALDANPGNNYGDADVDSTCQLTFCWQITTVAQAACVDGISSAVAVNTLSDYEVGSWTSAGCLNDPITSSPSILSCCPAPTMSSTSTSCGLNNGTATATANGNFGPWDYEWRDDANNLVINSQNVNGPSTISNLATGQYFVSVTDVNGCLSTGIVTVGTSAGATVTASNTGPYCVGDNISLNVLPAGTAYSWSGPNSFTASTQNPTINSATTAESGTYSVTVTISGGCTATSSTTVSVNNPAAASLTVTSDSICPGGSSTLTASAGASYIWNDPAASTTGSINVSPASTTTYSVTVSNGGSCTASASATITVNLSPVAAIAPANPSICPGANITLTASGGDTYLWNDAGSSTTAAISVSPAATTSYGVTVTDANACTGSASTTVTVSNNATATISPASAAICAGQNTTLTASGGNTFLWNDAAASTTAAITVSPASTTTYTVTVSTNGVCTATASATVTVNTNPVAGITPAPSSICPGGSSTLTATGGLSYLWSDASVTQSITVTPSITTTYDVTVTDANTCTATATSTITVNAVPVAVINPLIADICIGGSATFTASGGVGFLWSEGSTTPSITVTPATTANYQVTVTDANACTGSASATVNVQSGISISAVITDASCFGGNDGAIDVTVSGAPSAPGFIWSDNVTTEDRTGIIAGTYSVTVTSGTCSASGTYTVNEPTEVTLLLVSQQNVSCNGGSDGSITVAANGGTLDAIVTDYVYVWSNAQTGPSATALAAGSYSVTASDANGCSASLSFTITEASPVTLNPTTQDALCFAAPNGSISANPAGGNTPYSFLWSNAQTTPTATSLVAGSYSVTVTDASGCTASAAASVAEPTDVLINTVVTAVKCPGQNDGTITVTASGGVSPYSYSATQDFANFIFTTDGVIIGLAPGDYSVIVSDDNGCTDVVLVTVPDATPIIS